MRILGIMMLGATLAGCASATRGWDEQISIASTPSGATAKLSGPNNSPSCVTPCVVQVRRSDEITVSFEKEGFEPQVVALTKEIAGTGAAGFAGNILLGGIIGMGVDAATGAALDHKPNPVIVTLQPIAPPAPPAPKRQGKPVS